MLSLFFCRFVRWYPTAAQQPDLPAEKTIRTDAFYCVSF